MMATEVRATPLKRTGGRLPLWPVGLLLAVQWLVPAKTALAGFSGVFTPGTVVALLLIVPCVWQLAVSTEWMRAPVPWALLAFLSLALASYIAAAYRQATVAELHGADRGLVLAFAWVGAGLYVGLALDSLDRLNLLIKLVVVLTALVAGVAVLQVAGIDLTNFPLPPGLVRVATSAPAVATREGLARVSGTTAHPIELGILLSSVIPLAFAHREWKRWYWLCATGAIAVAIPFALSRSGLLGLVVALLCAAYFSSWRERLIGLAGTIGLVACLYALVPKYVSGSVGLFYNLSQDPSVTGRTKDYSAIVPFLQARPLLGLGLRSFIPQQYFFLDNQYLMTALDMGLLGLLCLISLLGLTAARFWLGAKRAAEPEGRRMFAALLAAMGSIILGLGSFDGFSFPTFTFLLFVIVGVSTRRPALRLTQKGVP